MEANAEHKVVRVAEVHDRLRLGLRRVAGAGRVELVGEVAVQVHALGGRRRLVVAAAGLEAVGVHRRDDVDVGGVDQAGDARIDAVLRGEEGDDCNARVSTRHGHSGDTHSE